MAFRLLLPKFGMAMESAKIVEWKKEVGDPIAKEEAVLVVENEKLTNEIISMEAGILLKKVATEGEKYLVGDLLAYIGEAGERVEEASGGQPGNQVNGEGKTNPAGSVPVAEGPAPEKRERVAASPLAKKMAAQLGIAIDRVTGSGPGGRIEKADVEQYAASQKQQQEGGAALTPEPQAPASAAAARAVQDEAAGLTREAAGAYTEIPYTGMRQAVGRNMLQAWTTVPMVTHHVKADAGGIMKIRESLNQGAGDTEGKVTFNDMLLKLTAVAIKRMPAVNASLRGDTIRVYRNVNLGMATALDNGLIVPVIRDADKKSLMQISREARELSTKARNGKLMPDDVADGTFTVTNLGGYGSVDEFTPIVNPPQAAILGVGRIVETPAFIDGDLQARPMITLSFTYDHRVLDGAVAAQFIKLLMDLLADPLRPLCE